MELADANQKSIAKAGRFSAPRVVRGRRTERGEVRNTSPLEPVRRGDPGRRGGSSGIRLC